MEKPESILHYYESTHKPVPEELLRADKPVPHFNILKRNNCVVTQPFIRRDYYKICLADGNAILHTAQGPIHVNQPYISFSNPELSFGWQPISQNRDGFVCLFNELYLSGEQKAALRKLYDTFKGQIYPFIFLAEEEYDLFLHYFKLLHEEYNSCFTYKNEVVGSLLKLIIYLGIRIQTSRVQQASGHKVPNRIVHEFLELLDSQFPVDSPYNAIPYKTPSDFARQLHVHVNHLNHSIKSGMGKSTTQAINEKIILEALNLLRNTDWTITQIGNSLGFEYPQHFNIFFKKQTGHNPKTYRSHLFENI